MTSGSPATFRASKPTKKFNAFWSASVILVKRTFNSTICILAILHMYSFFDGQQNLHYTTMYSGCTLHVLVVHWWSTKPSLHYYVRWLYSTCTRRSLMVNKTFITLLCTLIVIHMRSSYTLNSGCTLAVLFLIGLNGLVNGLTAWSTLSQNVVFVKWSLFFVYFCTSISNIVVFVKRFLFSCLFLHITL